MWRLFPFTQLVKRSHVEEQTRSSISGSFLKEMFSFCTLIGYDSNYFYVLYYNSDEMIVSRVNYITKCIEDGIYRSRSSLQFSSYIRNDQIYIGESTIEENDVLSASTLKCIDLQNGIDAITEEVVFQCEGTKYPYIMYSNDYILFNYTENGSYILSYMDYRNKNVKEIYRAEYEIDEKGLYTGEIPVYGNCNEQGVYFQLISLDKEMMDFEGEQALYFYSFQNGQYEPKLKLSDKITYMNGNEDMLILNDYSVDNPRVQTGKIISLTEHTISKIPETNAVNSIIDSFIEGDLAYIVSKENIFIYDSSQKTYAYMNIESDTRSNIKMYDSSFGFITTIDDSTAINIVR